MPKRGRPRLSGKERRAVDLAIGRDTELFTRMLAVYPVGSAWAPPKGTIPVDVLVEYIGKDAAIRLCQDWRGAKLPSLLTFLRQERRKAMHRDWVAGYTRHDLVRKYRVSLKWVANQCRDWRAERRAAMAAVADAAAGPVLSPLDTDDDE